MKVVVLGASGMLGSMVLDDLSRLPDLEVIGTVRSQEVLESLRRRIPDVRWRTLAAEKCGVSVIATVLEDATWAVNAIGVIKPYIHDDNPVEIERAVRVNSLFPHILAQAAERSDCRVLQIATDCVYSGSKGNYVETDLHDPLDVYGKTKSLGEVYADNVHHLRCSIIGPEPKAHVSLMEWFLGQSKDGTVSGYTNHQWNGVTTLHFARLCRGIISRELDLPHVQHIIPTGLVSKYELLKCFARDFGREDVTINPGQATTVIDRTLATSNEALNRRIWGAAGYDEPPTVAQMVSELAQFDFRLAGDRT